MITEPIQENWYDDYWWGLIGQNQLFLPGILDTLAVFIFVSVFFALNPSPAEPGYALPQANSVDPDQLASEEANWSGSALFAIKYVNLYQQSGSSNLIGWKLEMGMSS